MNPLQAFILIETKNEMLTNDYQFWEYQQRLNNWFIATTMGGYKRDVTDLYKISNEMSPKPAKKPVLDTSEPWFQKALRQQGLIKEVNQS